LPEIADEDPLQIRLQRFANRLTLDAPFPILAV